MLVRRIHPKKLLCIMCVLLAPFIGATTHSSVKNPPVLDVAFEEQYLSKTLIELAQISNVQIFANSLLTDTKKATPLKGKYTLDEALHTLLTPLELSYQWLNTSMIAVIHKDDSARTLNTINGVNDDTPIIRITGIKASIMTSLVNKANEIQITDSIEAEDLGKFPDLNLAESIQRVPGVTLNRNINGEGQAINLRGLGPQFTRVEINGMSGTANGAGGRLGISSGERGFNFELLASELFSNVTILKSPSAKQVEGGLAGVVSMQTPRPLSYDGLNVTLSAQGNYSGLTKDVDPRGSLFVTNNIDNVFGISFSAALSETSFRSDAAEGGSWRPGASFGRGETDALIPNGTRYFNFFESRNTFGSALTIQYRPSDDIEFTFDGIYAELDGERIANRNDIPIENPGPVVAVNEQNGVAHSGSFTNVQQRVGTNLIVTDEKLLQLAIKSVWSVDDNWKITPFLGYSKRKADREFDLYSFRLADENGFDPGTVSFNLRGNFVNFASTSTDFSNNSEDFLFNVFILRPSIDEDTELTTSLDVERFFDIHGLSSLQFGVRYANRDKDRYQGQTRLLSDVENPSLLPNLASVAKLLPYHVSGASFPGQQLSADPRLIKDVFFPNGQPVEGTVLKSFDNLAALGTWAVEEKTFNAYAQANFEYDEWLFNIGLRFVNTNQVSSGISAINVFNQSDRGVPTSFSNEYNKYLVSTNLKYNLTDELVLRATYSETLTRPNLPNLAPSERILGIDEGGGTGTRGNPELEPITADNIDVGLEWYFHKESLLSANIFYKDVNGLTDTTSFTEVRSFPRQSDGVIVEGPIVFTSFKNDVSAEIKGIEFAYQQLFMKNWGVIFNYTFADSSADFAVENDVRSTRLPGLSRSSYNTSAFFDNGQLEARFSYSWRDRYLAAFSDDFGVPRFTDDYGQLDFSVNYAVNTNLQLQLQLLNITNEQIINQSTALYLPYGVNELDRRALFGLRYHFKD